MRLFSISPDGLCVAGIDYPVAIVGDLDDFISIVIAEVKNIVFGAYNSTLDFDFGAKDRLYLRLIFNIAKNSM